MIATIRQIPISGVKRDTSITKNKRHIQEAVKEEMGRKTNIIRKTRMGMSFKMEQTKQRGEAKKADLKIEQEWKQLVIH